jgi:hypothetical protein
MFMVHVCWRSAVLGRVCVSGDHVGLRDHMKGHWIVGRFAGGSSVGISNAPAGWQHVACAARWAAVAVADDVYCVA